jgi:AcrR family transcriptional regulator
LSCVQLIPYRGHGDYDHGIPVATPKEKIRDAERSREAILDAAERLFSQRGFGGVSLSEIGAASGLSRATPSYFFGSKEQLYTAVLERVSAERQDATARAVAPIVVWCREDGSLGDLRAALEQGMESYMRFLLSRPAFQRFITWEELAGGKRLRAARRNSTALTDAFSAVKDVAKKRGLRSFAVEDAVLLWVSLTYAPLASRNTFLVALKRDLNVGRTRRQHIRLAADQMMFLLAGCTD